MQATTSPVSSEAPAAPQRRPTRWLLAALGYSLAYVALHLVAMAYRTPLGISPWYPPPALSVVAVMVGGRRMVPWVWITVLAIELTPGSVSISSTWLGAVLLATCLAGTYCSVGLFLRDSVRIDIHLRRLRDVSWFVPMAIVGAPLLAALSAIAVLILFEGFTWDQYLAMAVTFWIGDAIGVATLAPVLLHYGPRLLRLVRSRTWSPPEIGPEIWFQGAALLFAVWLSVTLQSTENINSFYICVLPLLWMALRHGFGRTTAGVLILNTAVVSILYTSSNTQNALVDLQLFMLMVGLTGLIVGAVTSEREHSDQRLMASEHYFRALFNASSDMITILGPQGVVRSESPSTRRILGYGDGLVGKRFYDFIHPEDMKRIRLIYEQSRDQPGFSPVVQYRFRHADGEWRWMESVADNIDDRAGIGGVIVNSRDVTERRSNEEVIRFQANLLNEVNSSVIVVDQRAHVTFWNRASERIYGWAATDMLGRRADFFDLMAINDEQVGSLHEVMERGVGWQGEVQLSHRLGYEVFVYVTASPLFDEQGTVSGLICVSSDITTLKQAQQQILEREQSFRSLIENASDLISIIDTDGVFYYQSPSVVRILGYEEGLVGRNAFEFIHPDDRPLVQAMLRRKLMRIRIGSPVVYRFRHANGTWRTIETVSNIINPDRDEPVRVILNSRDITERKRLEDALTAVAQGVAATTGVAFYRTLALQLSQALQVDYAYIAAFNPVERTVTTLIACERGHIVENFTYTLSGSPAERVFNGVTAIYRQGVQRMFPHDPVLQALDIESYLAMPLFDDTEGVMGMLHVMHTTPMPDVSLSMSILSIFAQRVSSEMKRKRAEEERLDIERKMMETQKLESLGLLAGGIAHDFNNFLTTILGNVGLALLETDEDGEAWPFLQAIEVAARHAADLSHQMLAYSGRGRFVISAFDVNQLIREMANLLQVSIGKQITVEYHFAPNELRIEGDATQIRQVVMNLIVNAAEAIAEPPGTITLRTLALRLDAETLATLPFADHATPGRYVCLEVHDTGMGMDAETRAKIFDPFFTTKFTGRGLGLAAVQGIVRAHQGVLTVASEPGEGSTFVVYLPLADPETEAALLEPAASPAEALPGGLILVIDDEEAIRNTTTRMLEYLGFRTIVARDGFEGLDLIAAPPEPIRAVMLDLTMPRLSGEETFRRLREINPQVPVVVMSGYNRAEAVMRIAGEGRADFLQKPFALATLHAMLAALLSAETPSESG